MVGALLTLPVRLAVAIVVEVLDTVAGPAEPLPVVRTCPASPPPMRYREACQ